MTPPPRKKSGPHNEDKVTLKTIAEHLGLTPGTVSAALNNSPAARSIPGHTKTRIIEAAQALNYRPNFFARTLRFNTPPPPPAHPPHPPPPPPASRRRPQYEALMKQTRG